MLTVISANIMRFDWVPGNCLTLQD